MTIVAIGDIGVLDGMIHLGDEAMFEECVLRMRERGLTDVVGLSSNPGDTAARYGIEALPQLGFRALTRTEQLARLELVRAAAGGADAADSRIDAVLAAVRRSDGVVITGGGNLASIWPANIAERVAVGEIARLTGTPLVITGQTLGPGLVRDDAESVGALLRSARLVGVRESASFELARRLGVESDRLQLTVDDASFLGAGSPVESGGYIAVTVSSHFGGVARDVAIAAIARLLDTVVAASGLDVVFVNHFGSLAAGDLRGDAAQHHEVAERMSAASTHAPVQGAREAAALARGAALVVSSRYHPVVFAASAGVPAIGIPVDDYTTVKLTGALGNLGQSGVVPLDEVVRGTDAAARVWADRDRIRERGHGAAVIAARTAESWWDRVAAALTAGAG